jgi:hypothetical protein
VRDKGGPVADVMTTIHGQMFADEDYSESAVDEFCDGIDDLWAWWTAAESARKATVIVKKAIARAIIKWLKGDAIRMDDAFICGMPQTVIKIIDQDGLDDYLELSAGAKAALDPSNINLRGIRAYAEAKGDDPDAIERRFFATEIDEYQPPWLKVTNMEWAPRWFIEAKPEHGQRVRPPDRRERKAS